MYWFYSRVRIIDLRHLCWPMTLREKNPTLNPHIFSAERNSNVATFEEVCLIQDYWMLNNKCLTYPTEPQLPRMCPQGFFYPLQHLFRTWADEPSKVPRKKSWKEFHDFGELQSCHHTHKWDCGRSRKNKARHTSEPRQTDWETFLLTQPAEDT